MAKEWYLLKSPHSQLSGFESEAVNDFAQEGFNEALDSVLAIDVELCNYDLSDCKMIRAVIQNNVQDTKLKTLTRQALVPIGTCKSGMYIKYKNRYWLIIGLVDDNGMYEKAVMALCNYHLTWLNDRKEIVQRWANITSASQYNNGETSTMNYYVRTDQLMIYTPDDDECVLLNTGKRFIIDRRCRIYEKSFGDDFVSNTDMPVIVYKITRSDSVLHDYQDGGHFGFMAYQDEQKEHDGCYLINGKKYWLCEEPIVNKTTNLSSTIEYDSLEIYEGLEAGDFSAVFYDANGNIVDITPEWEIQCDFSDSLIVDQIDNIISIYTDDERLINKTFDLILKADGYEPVSTTITIRAFF